MHHVYVFYVPGEKVAAGVDLKSFLLLLETYLCKTTRVTTKGNYSELLHRQRNMPTEH